jgi:glycerophosphoryl diester phosphodiesterase
MMTETFSYTHQAPSARVTEAMNPLLDLSSRPVVAHRGASGHAPENTLPAFELAIHQGADAIELDVRLTADGVPVVIHDPTLERTTDRRGSVAGVTLAQLRQADAGARFSPDGGRTFPYRGAGIAVPTLEEVLRAFPGTPFLVELKEAGAQDAVRRVLLQARAADRCVLASDETAAMSSFGAEPFMRAASRQEISELYWGTMLRAIGPALLGRTDRPAAAYRLLSVPARYRGLRIPTRGFVAAARELGCPVHVWTVNDPSLARRLWQSGAAGIVTNVPDRIRAVRGS